MKIWSMQVHRISDVIDKNGNKVPGKDISRDEAYEPIGNHNVIGMWDYEWDGIKWKTAGNQPKLFEHDMKEGDYVVIRHKGPLCLVKVTGEFKKNDKSPNSPYWFRLFRKVEIIDEVVNNNAKDKLLNDFRSATGLSFGDGTFLPRTLISANNWEFAKYWLKKNGIKVN